MPQVTGTVYNADGSAAGGVAVAGLVAGSPRVTVGPVTTAGLGRFVLAWQSPAAALARLYVNGHAVRDDVTAGQDFPVRLRG